jgi:hypothetical protein
MLRSGSVIHFLCFPNPDLTDFRFQRFKNLHLRQKEYLTFWKIPYREQSDGQLYGTSKRAKIALTGLECGYQLMEAGGEGNLEVGL